MSQQELLADTRQPLIEGTSFYDQADVDRHLTEAREHLSQFDWKGIELFDDSDPKLHRMFPGEKGTHYGLVGTEIPLSDTFSGNGIELLTPEFAQEIRKLPRQQRIVRLVELLKKVEGTPTHDDIWS